MNGTYIPDIATEIRQGVADGLAEIRATIRTEIAAAITPPPTQAAYYSRADVRRLLRVSATTLHTWEHNGTLVPVRIGRRVLYEIASVEAAIRGRAAA